MVRNQPYKKQRLRAWLMGKGVDAKRAERSVELMPPHLVEELFYKGLESQDVEKILARLPQPKPTVVKPLKPMRLRIVDALIEKGVPEKEAKDFVKKRPTVAISLAEDDFEGTVERFKKGIEVARRISQRSTGRKQ